MKGSGGRCEALDTVRVRSKTLFKAYTRQLKSEAVGAITAARYSPLCLPPSLPHAGSSTLRAYPLLSVITRQPPHLPQGSPPCGSASSHLPLQHHRTSEPSPSQTPLSISSESETESSAPRLKKPRRSRTIFTEVQLMGLEKKFQKQKYLSTPDRSVRSGRPDQTNRGYF